MLSAEAIKNRMILSHNVERNFYILECDLRKLSKKKLHGFGLENGADIFVVQVAFPVDWGRSMKYRIHLSRRFPWVHFYFIAPAHLQFVWDNEY